MRNRRGETQTGYLVPIAVALAVLVIIVITLWLFYSGKIQLWRDFPVPGQKNITLKGESATFRYLPASDIVEYYTGTAWEKFGGKSVDVAGKRASYEELSRAFFVYYWQGKREPEVLELPPQARNLIYYDDVHSPHNADGSVTLPPFFDARFETFNPTTVTTYARGQVIGKFVSKNPSDPARYGEFVVDLQGKLSLKRLEAPNFLEMKFREQDTKQEPYATIATQAIAWRDAVLQKPVSLSVGVLQGGREIEKETRQYCPEKIVYQGELSLVVRLEQPVSVERCT